MFVSVSAVHFLYSSASSPQSIFQLTVPVLLSRQNRAANARRRRDLLREKLRRAALIDDTIRHVASGRWTTMMLEEKRPYSCKYCSLQNPCRTGSPHGVRACQLQMPILSKQVHNRNRPHPPYPDDAPRKAIWQSGRQRHRPSNILRLATLVKRYRARPSKDHPPHKPNWRPPTRLGQLHQTTKEPGRHRFHKQAHGLSSVNWQLKADSTRTL